MSNSLRKKAELLMSTEYEKKVSMFFRAWIKGYYSIDIFSVCVILPDDNLLGLVNHPKWAEIYQENNYGLHDQSIAIKELYHQCLFYPLRTHNPSNIQNEIHLIREEIFNARSGTNFVRKITSNEQVFHIVYSVCKYDKDPLGYFKFACQMNEIFEIFDFAYNTLLPIFQENCPNYKLPKICQSAIIHPADMQKTLENYVFSREMFEGLPSFIKETKTSNMNSDQVRESLKLISNNYCLSTNQSKANLYMVKNNE